jgi:hypothetical protein
MRAKYVLYISWSGGVGECRVGPRARAIGDHGHGGVTKPDHTTALERSPTMNEARAGPPSPRLSALPASDQIGLMGRKPRRPTHGGCPVQVSRFCTRARDACILVDAPCQRLSSLPAYLYVQYISTVTGSSWPTSQPTEGIISWSLDSISVRPMTSVCSLNLLVGPRGGGTT